MKFWQKIALSLLLVLASTVACFFAINYSVAHSYGEILPDIMHNLIPYNYAYYVIPEIMLTVISLLFIGYIVKNKKYSELPLFLTALAIFYLLRALFVFIFPLKDPYPILRTGGIYNYFPAGGMFPSGHTGLVFMIYYFIKGNIKYLFLGLASFTAFFIIVSRLHYTIDVIGAIIITYGIYWLMKKYGYKTKIYSE
jgi:membrane-associated phospholipid phosphatase